ncbi:hypothetical protein I79_013651 [Cricetulus griseus]|uniref:Uncharacterized protein n=1 Tax=Cricetulus griseus TaxID=10029 RepID=G3HS26_CRIGR|nr:hypothetical protein I79_013651 [Cricetulus griseus]
MTSPVDDLSLEDSLGAAYNLPRRLSGPSKTMSPFGLFPIESMSNPEGAAAIGNHLIVTVLMCLNDVYV